MTLAASLAQEAGRVCPLDYTYAPDVFARAAEFSAETLYVVGGLYGNTAALSAIKAMAARETSPLEIVFNGDFHWFDAEAGWFAEIERRVAPYRALRGNVETEIARNGDIGAGCGCAYPETVSGDVVARSNEILALLQQVTPLAARARLGALPMHLVAQVGPLSVGMVHGDAAALAGWRFAQDELDNPKRQSWLADVRARSHVDVFASTHTCAAALRDFALPEGRLTVINNGAAGMPNFAGNRSGVITRIATTPSPHTPLYGAVRDGVHIDALAVAYDSEAFIARFSERWPPGSPAYQSYFKRIVERAGLYDRASAAAMTLSIIMPVLNEAAGLEAALAALQDHRARGVEIIVADGGSADNTCELARYLADNVISAPRGRAMQMNAGAAAARGDVLLFLHADTQLPANADRLVLDGLAQSNRIWGRFDAQFDGGALRLVAASMNLRSRLTGIATGDQAMFMTRAAFEQAGRFPPIALMEDVALSATLKRIGPPLCLDARVTTSGQRWRNNGTVRTVLLMWSLRLRFFFGADPGRLARAYGYR